jgi:hypothetical protein
MNFDGYPVPTRMGFAGFPHDDKAGGLNGSLQHLPNFLIVAIYQVEFVHAGRFKQIKALLRF